MSDSKITLDNLNQYISSPDRANYYPAGSCIKVGDIITFGGSLSSMGFNSCFLFEETYVLKLEEKFIRTQHGISFHRLGFDAGCSTRKIKSIDFHIDQEFSRRLFIYDRSQMEQAYLKAKAQKREDEISNARGELAHRVSRLSLDKDADIILRALEYLKNLKPNND